MPGGSGCCIDCFQGVGTQPSACARARSFKYCLSESDVKDFCSEFCRKYVSIILFNLHLRLSFV